MKDYIYIASAFQSLNSCGCTKGNQIDINPHIWSSPYTWGICRPDLRNCINPGDYVFYVFGSTADYPQTIFAYIKVAKVITHLEAFKEFRSKRMTSDKNPNGNIIVDYAGDYNKYDGGVHKYNFNKIKSYYAVADKKFSRKLTENEIIIKAKSFILILREVFSKDGDRPIHFISRKGRKLNEDQINIILKWLNK